MKKLPLVILLFVAAAITSCTHNNGDIGPWFGTWRLDNITVDGEPDTSYEGNIFFMFQSQVFCARTIYPYHLYSDSWARWSEEDNNILIIDYNNHDNLDTDQTTTLYMPPKITRMKNGVNRLHIDLFTSKTMILTLPDGADHEEIEYTLTKFI